MPWLEAQAQVDALEVSIWYRTHRSGNADRAPYSMLTWAFAHRMINKAAKPKPPLQSRRAATPSTWFSAFYYSLWVTIAHLRDQEASFATATPEGLYHPLRFHQLEWRHNKPQNDQSPCLGITGALRAKLRLETKVELEPQPSRLRPGSSTSSLIKTSAGGLISSSRLFGAGIQQVVRFLATWRE